MSELRQVVLASLLVTPFIIAAMIAVSAAANTLSSMPFLAAGVYGSIVGEVAYFVLPIGVFLFLVHATRGRSDRPGALSLLAYVAVVLGVAVWFHESWSYGQRYQGLFTMYLLAALNGASAAAVLAGMAYAFRRPSLRASVIVHWCLVVWAFGWAFPYLGEYP